MYTVTFTRPYLTGEDRFNIQRERVSARDEQQVRNIFADCEIILIEADCEEELAEFRNMTPKTTEADADMLHNLICKAEDADDFQNRRAALLEQLRTDEQTALAYGDKWLGELPPAKITTLQGLADAKERSFNRRYYNNPNGEPKFVYGGRR